MYKKPQESDWKKFRSMVPELRERYLRTKNEELAAILNDESLSPTERFWEIEERSRETAKVLRSCLDGHSSSRMALFMMEMSNHGMMAEEDIADFSEEIRQRFAAWKEL